MEVYSANAFDNDNKIALKVDFGSGAKFIQPGMDFYMEVLIEDVEKVEKVMELLNIGNDFEFVNRGKADVDNRPTCSILYRNLMAKEQLKTLCAGNNIELFNADIPEEFQWMLYHKHTPANFLSNLLLFDIEVDPTGFMFWDEVDESEKYKSRVYSIGCLELNTGIERFFIEEDEETLIKKFYSYAIKYTAFCGWNSSNFDVPYLIGRCKRLHINLDWTRIPQIDMMYAFETYGEQSKDIGDVVYLGLDRVANTYLSVGKIDVGGPAGIKKMWDEKDWLGLELYCMNDVRLMYELYNTIKGLRNVMAIENVKVQLGYLNPNKRYISAFVDNNFTKLAFENSYAVPQMNMWQHRDPETLTTIGAGGLVPKPKHGLHFYIVSIDFYSLYPTIYITHNCGVNTVDWNNEFADSICTEELSFRPTPKGLNALFMDYMLKARKEFRDERNKYKKGTPEYENLDIKQKAFKDMLVSANGVLEEKKFRYKNQAIYNSITKTGQVYLTFLIEAAELLGWELVEADTDGCHFLTPYNTVEEIVEALPQAETFIKDYVKEKAIEKWNIPEEYYVMLPRAEAISSHFYCITRKSYVRRVVWDNGTLLAEPRFEAKGMPGVKYNTLPLLKEILKNVFKKVVFTVGREEDYITLAVDYLLRIRDDLYSGRRDEWLTFAQRVDKLGGRLPHDRAAMILAERGLFQPAMIIHFIRRANGDIILPDYDKDFKVDFKTYDYYWTGAVAKWIQSLLPEVVGDKALGFKMAAPTKQLEW